MQEFPKATFTVDFVIPSNDDASKSIDKVLSFITDSIAECLADRKAEKEKAKPADKEVAPVKKAEKVAKAPKAAKAVEAVEAPVETPVEAKATTEEVKEEK